jgi:hypothetical protein
MRILGGALKWRPICKTSYEGKQISQRQTLKLSIPYPFFLLPASCPISLNSVIDAPCHNRRVSLLHGQVETSLLRPSPSRFGYMSANSNKHRTCSCAAAPALGRGARVCVRAGASLLACVPHRGETIVRGAKTAPRWPTTPWCLCPQRLAYIMETATPN